jgi:hypothetical protein
MMGCDIHGFVEVRQHNFWEGIINLNYFDRFYHYFCKIGGVRCYDDNPSCETDRGLPEDISIPTKELYKEQKIDAHSETWLTTNEFLKAVKCVDKSSKWWVALESMVRTLETIFGNENVRIVIWFDN